jgi:hypothetical protein
MAYASDNTFYSQKYKKTVKKITKSEARKLYDSGKTIYLNMSKMLFDNIWQPAISINKKEADSTFDSLVNSYSYYNRSKETGMVVHFYKEVKR